MKFEEMKVTELRDECKKRGLRICSHNHKYTKAELIKSLNEFEGSKVSDVCADVDGGDKLGVNAVSNNKEPRKRINYDDLTLDDIVAKYSHRKPKYVYDEILICGCYVVFVHEITTSRGEVVRKLRRGEVTNISRNTERVKVTLSYGTVLTLSYDDILYVCECGVNRGYPTDIYVFFNKQSEERRARIEEGRERRLQYGKRFSSAAVCGE